MKTEWNYTTLAQAYLKRPEYADDAISNMLEIAALDDGAEVCDVGAGTANLTLALARRGVSVTAVEPNDAMRKLGIERTSSFPNVTWHEGTGEKTGQPDSRFSLVTFGSSFNVTNRELALIEARRILTSKGWMACMWNHRDLQDPIQAHVEQIIKSRISDYQYGSRREDQTEIILESGVFEDVRFIDGVVEHRQSVEDVIDAWRSHATLQRQAGSRFSDLVDEISAYLKSLGDSSITTPYTTRLWMARAV